LREKVECAHASGISGDEYPIMIDIRALRISMESERRASAMTWEELEKAMQANERRWEQSQGRWDESWKEFREGMQEIRDQQLVTARLMETYQRQSNSRLERIETLALRHEERLGGLEAAMQALFERMDRFIRGQEGNGQKGQQ
jgi:hypothetical protein